MNIVAYPLGYLMYISYQVVKNYGLAIILFTLITKIILFPLSVKQQKSSAVMGAMSSKVKEIQKKHKNDRMKAQEEIMALYKENGVSQMAGCLPLLIQMPILFGLINVIYNPITHILRIPSDLITKALSIASEVLSVDAAKVAAREVLIKSAVDQSPSSFGDVFSAQQISSIQNMDFNFLGFNLSDVPTFAFNMLIIVPILSVVFMCISQFATMKASGTLNSTGAGTAKGMIIMSSIFTLSFSFSVPIGVSLYWMVSSIIQIFQSMILRKLYDSDKIKADLEEKILQNEKEKKKRLKDKKVKIIVDENKEEQRLSEKEYNKRRLAKARELDKIKYGDDSVSEEETEVEEVHESFETSNDDIKAKEGDVKEADNGIYESQKQANKVNEGDSALQDQTLQKAKANKKDNGDIAKQDGPFNADTEQPENADKGDDERSDSKESVSE